MNLTIRRRSAVRPDDLEKIPLARALNALACEALGQRVRRRLADLEKHRDTNPDGVIVFDRLKVNDNWHEPVGCDENGKVTYREMNGDRWRPVPQYSTGPSDALDLIVRLAQEGYSVRIVIDKRDGEGEPFTRVEAIAGARRPEGWDSFAVWSSATYAEAVTVVFLTVTGTIMAPLADSAALEEPIDA